MSEASKPSTGARIYRAQILVLSKCPEYSSKNVVPFLVGMVLLNRSYDKMLL